MGEGESVREGEGKNVPERIGFRDRAAEPERVGRARRWSKGERPGETRDRATGWSLLFPTGSSPPRHREDLISHQSP